MYVVPVRSARSRSFPAQSREAGKELAAKRNVLFELVERGWWWDDSRIVSYGLRVNDANFNVYAPKRECDDAALKNGIQTLVADETRPGQTNSTLMKYGIDESGVEFRMHDHSTTSQRIGSIFWIQLYRTPCGNDLFSRLCAWFAVSKARINISSSTSRRSNTCGHTVGKNFVEMTKHTDWTTSASSQLRPNV